MWTIEVRDAQGRAIARAELKDGAVTIGRGTDRNLILPVTSVSRKHARLELKSGKLLFTDEGSANGSFVNGQRVTAPTEVSDRSVIQLAEFRVVIEPVAEELDRTTIMRLPPKGPLPPLPDLVPASQWATTTPPAAPPAQSKPAAPAPKTAPAPAADLGSFIPIATPPPPNAPAARARPDTDWQATEVLDKQIQSFRSHREQTQLGTAERVLQLNQDWEKFVLAMRQLQARLHKEPRIQNFLISRDGKEVSIKIGDAREKRGYRYFLLTREHPEGKFPGLDVVWLRELGRDDLNFREPQKLLTELMQRIAGTLA